jgi:hypothetical protein
LVAFVPFATGSAGNALGSGIALDALNVPIDGHLILLARSACIDDLQVTGLIDTGMYLRNVAAVRADSQYCRERRANDHARPDTREFAHLPHDSPFLRIGSRKTAEGRMAQPSRLKSPLVHEARRPTCAFRALG